LASEPLSLGRLGLGQVHFDLGIDVLRERRVVVERGFDLFGLQREERSRPLNAVLERHIATDDTGNDLPYVGATDERGSPACRPVAECDKRVPSQPEALLDQLLRKG
jgi:hypothetical protein